MCILRDWRARAAAMTLTARRTPRTTRLASSAATIAGAAPHAWAHPAAAARERLDSVYNTRHLNSVYPMGFPNVFTTAESGPPAAGLGLLQGG